MQDTPKKRNWLILGLLGCAGLGLLVAAGVGGAAYWGWSVFARQAREALNRNPVIREHIGEVRDMEFEIQATGLEEGDDVFVFRVEGSKGAGVVTAEFDSPDADREEIRSGTLRLPSGKSHDLTVQDAEAKPR